MNNQILVSIIVPVYNAESYLKRCVDSILGQTYKNLQVILVDDGSTDSSGNLCDFFKNIDDRILVLHQKNSGVSIARNSGMDNASGEYLMFVDSDDTLKRNAVELLLSHALEYSADIVSAVKSTIDINGNEHCVYDDEEFNIYEGITPLKMSLEYDRQTNSACAKLFNKKFIGNTRFAAGRNINEDGYFIFECYSRMPKLVQHNISVYNYYVNKNSSSRREFSEKYFDMLYFAEKKMKYIKVNYPDLLSSANNMMVSTHLFFLEVLCRPKQSKYKKAQKESIRLVRTMYKQYTTLNKHEKKIALIVVLGLFPVYKFLVRMKYFK